MPPLDLAFFGSRERPSDQSFCAAHMPRLRVCPRVCVCVCVTCAGSPGSDQMRRELWKIHNGRDIIVPCACRWFGARGDTGYDDRCAEDEVEFDKQNYTGMALNSKFSLVVEGFGYHSFRCACLLDTHVVDDCWHCERVQPDVGAQSPRTAIS